MCGIFDTTVYPAPHERVIDPLEVVDRECAGLPGPHSFIGSDCHAVPREPTLHVNGVATPRGSV